LQQVSEDAAVPALQISPEIPNPRIVGACTLSHGPFPYNDIWDPLARVFDAFGFDRCMWGTDWTRAVGMLTYEQGIEAFRVAGRLSDSERAVLMGDTLQHVYNWHSPAA
jgi:predicted TIM-barrel fold metal-dependent hydrolase